MVQLHRKYYFALTCFVLILTFTYGSGYKINKTSSVSYKAAVYEHAVISPPDTVTPVTREIALENMMKNLEIYRHQVETAAREEVDIIVFPEDGLYGIEFNRAALEPYLEYIPDPKIETWIPCSDPGRYASSEVQQFLSCLAMNNSVYLVANAGDFQPCNMTSDPECPPDGHYQYNTNIVYDKKGTLIARYHKRNLFFEYQFDTPKSTEFIYFDTSFGRFGVFTCFDIMFEKPAVYLITKYNVTNIAFPAAWMDAPPLLAGIQFHSAFAAGLGVNLLSANIHLLKNNAHGSGIYSPEGALSFYYNDKSNEGKLLINEVRVAEQPNEFAAHAPQNEDKTNKVDFVREYVHTINKENESKPFNSTVFHDVFTFVPLNFDGRDRVVCYNTFCCHLEYEFADGNSSEYFAFGAFDGLHTYEGRYYLQICTLLMCEPDLKLCGNSKQSSTRFRKINIRGTFETNYVFPEILLIENNTLALPKLENWTFENRSLSFYSDQKALLSASLFGRVYDRDSNGAESPSCLSRNDVYLLVMFFSLMASVALSTD